MRIGFFDSGIGGISVLAEALSHLPDARFIFLADEENAPYGTKDTEEIARLALENTRFLLTLGVDAIVVACNTATAAAINSLREISQVPVVGMEPAVKPAVELFGAEKNPGESRSRVLVTATPLTLREAKLKDLIERVDAFHRVDLLPLPGLVPLAERGEFGSDEARCYLKEALKSTDPSHYAALVMGCTHFVFFAPLFRELMGDGVKLVDGNAGTVRRLADVTGLKYCGSANEERFEQAIESVEWYISRRKVMGAAEIERFKEICRKVTIRRIAG